MDRHPRRPRLRLELSAAGALRGLRLRRRQGDLRPRLRGRLAQGDEPRSLRPEVTPGGARLSPRRLTRPGLESPAPAGYASLPNPTVRRSLGRATLSSAASKCARRTWIG